MTPPYRLAKKRTLQKAGFVHVAGWVKVDDAPEIQAKIDAAAPKVKEAIQDDKS